MIRWHGPFQIGEWLRTIHTDEAALPLEKAGAYLISRDSWEDSPECDCHPLWVGGQRTRTIRIRLGNFIGDAFGLYSEEKNSAHIGGRKMFKWCQKTGTSLMDLRIAWCVADCHRCVERTLYDHLKPSGTLLNRNRPDYCPSHDPCLSYF